MLLESIKLKDGQWYNLNYHQERIDRSRQQLCSGWAPPLDLITFLQAQDIPEQGLYKVRIIYLEQFQAIEFQKYQIKPIRSLQLVNGDHLDYSLKYQDRRDLEQVYELRGNSDDILIIRDGRVTDTYYANVAFWDGSHWYTPASPLLAGVKRAALLAQQVLTPRRIGQEDLRQFHKLRLINAMIDLEDRVEVDLTAITDLDGKAIRGSKKS